ncbi:MAG TPA: sulfite exporter TauE/SafE family protein [Halieaceae bacterium]|nr:sulfite exporter TauE/SafE family protein [Halieaceae bacterium]
MELAAWEVVVLIVAGFAAGLVNVMAGGGSILTVPIMMFLGMPGPVANGTNRITIVAHNAAAMATYLRHGVPHAKLCLSLTLVAIPPALIGAWLSTRLDTDQFEGILAVVMVAVLILMQAPQGRVQGNAEDTPKNLLTGHLLMALAGLWGGFIQIGMGFIVLPIMHRVMGLSLVSTNILKVFIIFTYTLLAVFVFAATSEVLWLVGAIAGIGNVFGGMVGARLTLTHGEKLIRCMLTVAIVAMIIKLVFFS